MSEEKISIKVNICDRFFPLSIYTSEEESIRKAAKTINERAKHYTDNFSIQDKQDALSMVALEFASDSKDGTTSGIDFENINSKLKQIEQLLNI